MKKLVFFLIIPILSTGPAYAVKHSTGDNGHVSGLAYVKATDDNETPKTKAKTVTWSDTGPPWNGKLLNADTTGLGCNVTNGKASSSVLADGAAMNGAFVTQVYTQIKPAVQALDDAEDNEEAGQTTGGISRGEFDPDATGASTQHLWTKFETPYPNNPYTLSGSIWVEGGTHPNNEQWWVHSTYKPGPKKWDVTHSNGFVIANVSSFDNFWVRPVDSFNGVPYYMEANVSVNARLKGDQLVAISPETDAEYAGGSAIY